MPASSSPLPGSVSAKIAVVIPYYQRESGILRRALTSILQQRVSQDVSVHVIVVDDGSPISANTEAEGLDFKPPFHLAIVAQSNSGVATARNTGLKSVDPDTTYIAFLDSDDIWREGHLKQGTEALERGYDFYFCDNEREGHHSSNFGKSDLLNYLIAKSSQPDELLPITQAQALAMILRDFPCQASTTLYRYAVAPHLRFDTTMKNAGEDLIFFMQLAAKALHICVSSKRMVYCGCGINLYFANLNWHSDEYMKRIIDQLWAHRIIQRSISLNENDSLWNALHIGKLKRDIAFHAIRLYIQNERNWPIEVKMLAAKDRWFYFWFPIAMFQVAIGKSLKLYHPL